MASIFKINFKVKIPAYGIPLSPKEPRDLYGSPLIYGHGINIQRFLYTIRAWLLFFTAFTMFKPWQNLVLCLEYKKKCMKILIYILFIIVDVIKFI